MPDVTCLVRMQETNYGQRLLRWKLIQDFEKVEKSFDDLIGNGKSGNAFNVKKYRLSLLVAFVPRI